MIGISIHCLSILWWFIYTWMFESNDWIHLEKYRSQFSTHVYVYVNYTNQCYIAVGYDFRTELHTKWYWITWKSFLQIYAAELLLISKSGTWSCRYITFQLFWYHAINFESIHTGTFCNFVHLTIQCFSALSSNRKLEMFVVDTRSDIYFCVTVIRRITSQLGLLKSGRVYLRDLLVEFPSYCGKRIAVRLLHMTLILFPPFLHVCSSSRLYFEIRYETLDDQQGLQHNTPRREMDLSTNTDSNDSYACETL